MIKNTLSLIMIPRRRGGKICQIFDEWSKPEGERQPRAHHVHCRRSISKIFWLLTVSKTFLLVHWLWVLMTLRIRQQYPWEWEFTFHTVLQCFCNLYYSTCFWAKWFARMKCCGQQVIFLHFADEWWWNIENTPRQKRMFVRWWWDDVKEFEKIVVQYKTYIYRMYLILKCFCNVTLPTLSLFLFWCYSDFDQTERNWRRNFYDKGFS